MSTFRRMLPQICKIKNQQPGCLIFCEWCSPRRWAKSTQGLHTYWRGLGSRLGGGVHPPSDKTGEGGSIAGYACVCSYQSYFRSSSIITVHSLLLLDSGSLYVCVRFCIWYILQSFIQSLPALTSLSFFSLPQSQSPPRNPSDVFDLFYLLRNPFLLVFLWYALIIELPL